jgi:hypothetical protein
MFNKKCWVLVVLICRVGMFALNNSFQAPGVFHAGPALLGPAIDRARLELAFGQTSPGRFV